MKQFKMPLLVLATVAGTLLQLAPAYALPVLDANVPSTQMVTIYPDNLDKNLFYLVPKNLQVSADSDGVPMFSFTELGRATNPEALIQVAVEPAFDDATLDKAKASILATNPAARFASVPFIKSSIVFSKELSEVVASSDCNHPAGVVGSEEDCLIKLNSEGRRVLENSFRQKATIYFNLNYVVEGVTQDGKGGYNPYEGSWDLMGSIGGEELAKYPQLFVNTAGNPIRFSKK